LESYKNAASICKSAIRVFITNYQNNLTTEGNLGNFYRYANSKFCSKSPVSPNQDVNGFLATDPQRKADILQQAFRNNHTVDIGSLHYINVKTYQFKHSVKDDQIYV
jgi:hypothetical protein